MKRHYRSCIPSTARERVVATFVDSPQKYKAEYMIGGVVVGVRFFHRTGDLEYECPLRNGVPHGVAYRSDVPGKLLSAEPYSNGLSHGVAKQWSDGGKLIGTYRMKHGTGIDLWWCENYDTGVPWLSEVRHLKRGKWHGFEWWLNEDQKSVSEERHFREGQLHGIERSWNHQGGLRHGYPRYWVNNRRVTKRQYLRACAQDPSLPPFWQSDNQPGRVFPAEVKLGGN